MTTTGRKPLWTKGWRARVWSQLQANPKVDVLVIGGGITGAGVAHAAAQAGLRTVIVEQQDFAAGASSRSSKMVHGGLRYLSQKQFALTRDSIKERERLIDELPGLVEPMWFMFGRYQGNTPSALEMRFGLWLYDLIAGERTRQRLSPAQALARTPELAPEGLEAGYLYLDAATDDSRLVFRAIQEAVAAGGFALNRCALQRLRPLSAGQQVAVLYDNVLQEHLELQADVVINATGVQSDQLRGQLNCEPQVRAVRGSHLLVPHQRLPLKQVVSFSDPQHPKRPMFAYPWEGAVVLGTTDIDHGGTALNVAITQAEVEHILAAVNGVFPDAQLSETDVIASYAGLRPLQQSEAVQSSEVPRHHHVVEENGLISVTGGKLTTFRITAMAALKKGLVPLQSVAASTIHALEKPALFSAADEQPPANTKISWMLWRRLQGRYGPWASEVVAAAQKGELEVIAGTASCLAEVRWAAKAEMVEHLGDLLLRRTRLGLLLPNGGEMLWPAVQTICKQELAWDKARWAIELAAYQQHYKKYYSLPARRADLPAEQKDG